MPSIPVRFVLRWVCLAAFCWLMGIKGSMEIAWLLYGVAIYLDYGLKPSLPDSPKEFNIQALVILIVLVLLIFAAGHWEIVSEVFYEGLLYPVAVVSLFALIAWREHRRFVVYRGNMDFAGQSQKGG